MYALLGALLIALVETEWERIFQLFRFAQAWIGRALMQVRQGCRVQGAPRCWYGSGRLFCWCADQEGPASCALRMQGQIAHRAAGLYRMGVAAYAVRVQGLSCSLLNAHSLVGYSCLRDKVLAGLRFLGS